MWLIKLSFSVVLNSEQKTGFDFTWFSSNTYIVIIEYLNKNILLKNDLHFSIRTLSYCGELLLFVEKYLTEFQLICINTIFVTFWKCSYIHFFAERHIYYFVFCKKTGFPMKDFSGKDFINSCFCTFYF